MEDKRVLEKVTNVFGAIVIAAFIICAFMIMNSTAESNSITVDVAKIQTENKTRVVKEVALLTAEIKNLQKDMDKILENIEYIKVSSGTKGEK